MKTLLRWAARLYPAAWRARYGDELEALLEDAGPRGGDLWDVLRGALLMQTTRVSFQKIVSACTLAGVLVAGIWSAAAPKRYVSTAMMRFHVAPASTPGGEPTDPRLAAMLHMQAVAQTAFSRASLAKIILGQNLYPHERRMIPLEEVIELMRNRDLRIQELTTPNGTAFSVSFTNENPAATQATARNIVSTLIAQNARLSGKLGEDADELEVLDQVSVQPRVAGPNRVEVIGAGIGVGLVLGLVCGALWSMARGKDRRSLRRIGAFAAAGMALGLTLGVTIALLIPAEFRSTAVLRTVDGSKVPSTLAQVLSDDSLAAIIREYQLYSRERSRSTMHDVIDTMRNQHIRVQPIPLQRSAGWAAFSISFAYPDSRMAQQVTRELATRFITVTGAPLSQIEVLDPANLPRSPISPHRLNIAALGTVAGILLGIGAALSRRFRHPATA